MTQCKSCGRPLSSFSFGMLPEICENCKNRNLAAKAGGSSLSQFPMTLALIGINVAVFVGMVLSGVSPAEPSARDLVRWGADFGLLTVGYHQWWRLVTSGFIHIGIIHLALNMWCLWVLGRKAE